MLDHIWTLKWLVVRLPVQLALQLVIDYKAKTQDREQVYSADKQLVRVEIFFYHTYELHNIGRTSEIPFQ